MRVFKLAILAAALALFAGHAFAQHIPDPLNECRVYADTALSNAKKAKELACGWNLNDGRWGSTREGHSNWCGVVPKDQSDAEANNRRAAISRCAICRSYANVAVADAELSETNQCKSNTGPVWDANPTGAGHFNWCMALPASSGYFELPTIWDLDAKTTQILGGAGLNTQSAQLFGFLEEQNNIRAAGIGRCVKEKLTVQPPAWSTAPYRPGGEPSTFITPPRGTVPGSPDTVVISPDGKFKPTVREGSDQVVLPPKGNTRPGDNTNTDVDVSQQSAESQESSKDKCERHRHRGWIWHNGRCCTAFMIKHGHCERKDKKKKSVKNSREYERQEDEEARYRRYPRGEQYYRGERYRRDDRTGRDR